MPTNLELLDSLPGTGKTTAIFKYMSEHRQQPWLYLSPAASEAYDRAVEAAANFEMEIYIPTEESDITKTEQILEFLEEGGTSTVQRISAARNSRWNSTTSTLRNTTSL